MRAERILESVSRVGLQRRFECFEGKVTADEWKQRTASARDLVDVERQSVDSNIASVR